MRENQKTNDVFVVIGGTSGIGLAIAQELSGTGLVYLGGRRSLSTAGLNYLFIDVTDEKSIANFFARIDSEHGKLSGLIYSAGISSAAHDLDKIEATEFAKMMAINVTGAALCMKQAHALLKKGSGKVVLVSSLAGRFYSKTASLEYTTSKAALNGLGKQLAVDLAKDGILINMICPSQTKTPMLEKVLTAKDVENLARQVPLGRIATPEEIARLTKFLVSGDNTYMTGLCIDINGGQYF